MRERASAKSSSHGTPKPAGGPPCARQRRSQGRAELATSHPDRRRKGWQPQRPAATATCSAHKTPGNTHAKHLHLSYPRHAPPGHPAHGECIRHQPVHTAPLHRAAKHALLTKMGVALEEPATAPLALASGTSHTPHSCDSCTLARAWPAAAPPAAQHRHPRPTTLRPRP